MPSSPDPQIEVTSADGNNVVRITGCDRLTDFNIEAVSRQLNGLVEGRGPQHLLLDLSDIDYLTSTALGKLISLNRKLRDEGGKLTLVNPTSTVQEILAVTRLDRLINVQGPAGDGPRSLCA